nr:protein dispatched homolog 3-like [Camelus dromedarius]
MQTFTTTCYMLPASAAAACQSPALVSILTSCPVFLSFSGIASIGLSCLVALFLYHVVFGIQYLGILSGLAAFLIVGIGVDDVIVFINTYRQATHLEDPQLRMIHTIQTAGKATFFTSLTTAAAKAANIFSQVGDHPLPLFVSLIVSCRWLAVFISPLPRCLAIWSLYTTHCAEGLRARPAASPRHGQPGPLTAQLQELLHRWVLWSAVKSRWVIVGD